MSMSLYLTRYSKLEEQKYSEENSCNLAIVEMSDDLYKEILKEYVCKQEFWEKGEEEGYLQEIILNADIDKILKKCVQMSKEIMKEIVEKEISCKEENVKLDRLHVILEIRNILNKKKDKYAYQDDVFVIVG